MIVAGVIGKAGSGKDTVSDYLVSEHSFVKIALADPIRELSKCVFGLEDSHFSDREKRERELSEFPGWTPRTLLQFIGTELFRRRVDEDVWIKAGARKIKKLSNAGESRFIISDVRFPNERTKLAELLGIKVVYLKVSRPGIGGVGIEGHESESYELDGDFLLVNDVSIQDLYGKVDEVVASFSR